jgi:hypothetical protein
LLSDGDRFGLVCDTQKEVAAHGFLDSAKGPSATVRPFLPETTLPSFCNGWPESALPSCVSRWNHAAQSATTF